MWLDLLLVSTFIQKWLLEKCIPNSLVAQELWASEKEGLEVNLKSRRKGNTSVSSCTGREAKQGVERC